MAETLLFIGTMLVAFQYVGDIGFIASLFSLPFTLPLKFLAKKLGIGYKRVSPTRLSFHIDQPTEKTTHSRLRAAIWWILLVPSIVVAAAATIATSPIMLAYLLICRPLLGINKLLNLVYKKTISEWDSLYLTIMQSYIGRIGMTKKKYSDKELLEIREKKGEIPFLAFIGVLCIVAAFILHIVQ